jgi:serine/threonine-protein kinase
MKMWEKIPNNVLLNGRYRVHSLLGSGTYGRVYCVYDILQKQYFALKQIPPRSVAEEAQGIFRKRIEREFELSSKLCSPFVARAYDTFECDDVFFIVFEMIFGESVKQLLLTRRFPLVWLPHIALHIAQGLEAIHAAGFIHRDVKATNVVVKFNPTTKRWEHAVLLDLGIAYSDRQPLTQPLSALGTPEYMAPELLIRQTVITPAADVYAIGIMLYEMATGSVPFSGDNAMQIAVSQLNDSIPSLPSHPPQPYGRPFWQRLQHIIRCCTVKTPEQRCTIVQLKVTLSQLWCVI